MNKNENLVIEVRSMLYKHSTSNFMLLPNRWNGQSLTFSIAIFLDLVVFTVCFFFLSSIGKLWADGGLRDLLVDSGVYAGNTAELMLVGKEINRAVRGFTLVFEALRGIHTLV